MSLCVVLRNLDRDKVRNAGVRIVFLCSNVFTPVLLFSSLHPTRKENGEAYNKSDNVTAEVFAHKAVYLPNCEQSPVTIVTTLLKKQKREAHCTREGWWFIKLGCWRKCMTRWRAPCCALTQTHTLIESFALCTNQIHFCLPACSSPSGRPFIIYLFFIPSPHFACIGAHMVSRARALRYFLSFLLAQSILAIIYFLKKSAL